jgi:BON domain-containing protein
VSIPTLLGLLLLIVVPVWGQARPSAPDSSISHSVLTGDESLTRSIRERFAASKISTNNFRVRVKDGVAIIQGTTDVIQHKGVATRLAKLAGAKSVDNRIKLSERARLRAAATRRNKARRVQVEWRKPRRTER